MTAALGPTRTLLGRVSEAQQRLLEVLSSFSAPATLAQIATAAGLHENTVRAHLEALREHGHVTRLRVAPAGPGRPAWSWLARPSAYAGLAEALARGLEDGEALPAREAGRSGGRAWGERLAAQLAPGEASARRRLVRVLEHVGFAPEPVPDGSVRLRRCPFLDAARAHPDTVCAVHRGLIEGALGHAVGPTTLRSFAEPGACLIAVTPPTEADGGRE